MNVSVVVSFSGEVGYCMEQLNYLLDSIDFCLHDNFSVGISVKRDNDIKSKEDIKE